MVKKNLSILLPHSDDELFILPFIKMKMNQGHVVNVFFITSDFNPMREEESLKVLADFGDIRIVQFGRLNDISDGQLSLFAETVSDLLEKNSLIQSSDFLVTPIFEGGHVDHDGIFKIGHQLACKLQKTHLAFSLYNAYGTPFVRVASIILGPVQGTIETIHFSLAEGLTYLKKSFCYKSQRVILAVLFPGLVWTFLVKRKIEILKVAHFNPVDPHPGRIFYKNPWKNKIKYLLRVT